MGSTRLVLTVLIAIALTTVSIWPKPRRALQEVIEKTRWKFAGVPSDEHYRRAERFYQAGDFEKSMSACSAALMVNPNHAPARALFMEIRFILGAGKATPCTSEYDRFMTNPGMITPERLIVDMDEGLARAEQLVAADNPEGAEKQYRKVLEFAKWLPAGFEVEQRAQIARSGLTCLFSGREY